MAKEELKQEAEEYVKQNYCEICVMADDCKSGCIDCFTVQAYLASAKPREKHIAELEAQIEKMKCCQNCKHSRTVYEHCRTNKREKWEIKND